MKFLPGDKKYNVCFYFVFYVVYSKVMRNSVLARRDAIFEFKLYLKHEVLAILFVHSSKACLRPNWISQ